MAINGISSSSPLAVPISGLRAQRLRMDVIAGNIANAHTTRTSTGQPYRRKYVVLGAAGGERIDGVRILSIAEDKGSEFKEIYDPDHPDAENGFVKMPNVDLPKEMMNLVAASRAYQANIAVLKRYQDAVNVTLELLR